ncbi:MAG: hypothetical protein WA209_01380 [Candidatus Acidiferrales bacterium]
MRVEDGLLALIEARGHHRRVNGVFYRSLAEQIAPFIEIEQYVGAQLGSVVKFVEVFKKPLGAARFHIQAPSRIVFQTENAHRPFSRLAFATPRLANQRSV